MNKDEDLTIRFSALRRENERRVLDYRNVRARRRKDLEQAEFEDRSNDARWWVPGLTLAFAATAAALLWFSGETERTHHDEQWTAGQWAMPTDVLLDLSALPGDDLLYELPDFGTLPVQSPDGAQNSSSTPRIPV